MRRKEIFHSPTKGKMNIEKVAKEISSFIKQKPGKYQLVVGTDSEGSKRADFITAIIAHRIGRGGIYFWKRTNGNKIYHTLRQRIYEEVNLSLHTAQRLLENLGKHLHYSHSPGCDLQIHIDVGKNGPTKDIIKEVVGIVRGNGFEAKIKPESYGASIVADKHV
ncbi:ribonuclease H-like YkuK family protein [bacterium]|nr:ribonuclease H-like YkuK family protein [bacterium]